MVSSLVSPLYTLYQDAFGFSELTLTLVYAVYVAGNLCGLLFLGRLSDQLGRRPVALASVGLAALTAALFLFARGTAWLFWARVFNGLAVAVASGAAAAWLVELIGERKRAALFATAANFSGIAAGPLVGGALAQYAPWPLHLPFIAYAATLAPLAWAVMRAPETVERRRSLREISLKPRVGIPADALGDFIPPAATAFVAFALGGFYLALAPSLVKHDLGIQGELLGGLVISELYVVSVATMIATRSIDSRKGMTGALLFVFPSVALLAAAQAYASLPLLLAGSASSGACIAFGYRSTLERVNAIAPDDRRAEVTSAYLVATFAGNCVPVIGVGWLSTRWSPLGATGAFAVTLAIVAACALAMLRQRSAAGRRHQQT